MAWCFEGCIRVEWFIGLGVVSASVYSCKSCCVVFLITQSLLCDEKDMLAVI